VYFSSPDIILPIFGKFLKKLSGFKCKNNKLITWFRLGMEIQSGLGGDGSLVRSKVMHNYTFISSHFSCPLGLTFNKAENTKRTGNYTIPLSTC